MSGSSRANNVNRAASKAKANANRLHAEIEENNKAFYIANLPPLEFAIFFDTEPTDIESYAFNFLPDHTTIIQINAESGYSKIRSKYTRAGNHDIRPKYLDDILKNFREKRIDVSKMMPFISILRYTEEENELHDREYDMDFYDPQAGIQEKHIYPPLAEETENVNDVDSANIYTGPHLTALLSKLPTSTSGKPLSNVGVFFSWNRTLTMFQKSFEYDSILERIDWVLSRRPYPDETVYKVGDKTYRLGDKSGLMDNTGAQLDRKAILNSMMIYLFGGEARLNMIRDMLDMLYEQGVQIFIISGNSDSLLEYVNLLTDKIPKEHILYSKGEYKGRYIRDLVIKHNNKKFKAIVKPHSYVNNIRSAVSWIYGGRRHNKTRRSHKKRSTTRKHRS